MLAVLRVLVRPWRVVRRVVSLKNTVLTQLCQLLDLQREVKAEVRDLHESSLLAAIHLIEEQRRVREELARKCADLEHRLAVLERQFGTSREGAPGELDRAA